MKDFAEELARLRRDVDELKAILNRGSGQTTKAERKALRLHIEEMDKAKRNLVPQKRTNPFKINQIVELKEFTFNRTKGKIQYIACRLALPSMKECEKESCQHKNPAFVWVSWPDKKIISYHFTKLKIMSDDELKPKIGRELSGRIGPWYYNAETKLWKKDGADKEYTNDEFSDLMYFESHEYAKDESNAFIKAIKI